MWVKLLESPSLRLKLLRITLEDMEDIYNLKDRAMQNSGENCRYIRVRQLGFINLSNRHVTRRVPIVNIYVYSQEKQQKFLIKEIIVRLMNFLVWSFLRILTYALPKRTCN